MTISLLSMALFALSQTHCDIPLRVVHFDQDREMHIVGEYAQGEILIGHDIPRSELRQTVSHECGHALEDTVKHTKEYRSLFGKPPFVNSYASKDGEDFAESYAMYMDGKLPRGKKFSFIRSFLSKL